MAVEAFSVALVPGAWSRWNGLSWCLVALLRKVEVVVGLYGICRDPHRVHTLDVAGRVHALDATLRVHALDAVVPRGSGSLLDALRP